jgi:aspartyl protease family protein
MANAPGPWDPPPSAPRGKPAAGLFVWIVLLATLVLGIWQLSVLLPGRQHTTEDYALLVRNMIIIVVGSSSLIFMRRTAIGRAARDLGIWIGIGFIILLGYTYQDELWHVNARVMATLVPGYVARSGEKELVLSVSPDGHFHVAGTVNGAPVDFLVDTGASDVVLSPQDARRVGFDVHGLNFSRVYETANGIGRGAPVTLRSLGVGPILLADLAASVNQTDMTGSLLGMTFFRRVASFEVRGNNLFIRWR